MRSKVSRRAVVGGAMNTAAEPLPASSDAGLHGRWSPAELQAANEESERLMREAWRRLDARRAVVGGAMNTAAEPLPATSDAGLHGRWSPAELQAANEESERLMREAWRRLDARRACRKLSSA